ncbi:GntR family transcriptional regulator [Burkholderiaceae bacterium FT117]|uniref:GntR family transcriptional regulator n=1 Tax=Zeimonas sediminis TaxID=2944268 RepID=UPI002342CF41|nr:GntR family transcriptional regulator [Zeimonas sediminis]MCM5569938.1 GntR family transcriptional regulator [Zeimonas sediminis]
MAKPRTANLPDLSGLLEPATDFMRDIQRVLLRRGEQDIPSLSIAEQIASRLAGMIALDRLKPGQRVLEEEICAVLGVSRAPVREALRMLERDRLLVVVPRKGAQVSDYSPRELHDIFEVRASLIATTYEQAVRDHPEAFASELAAGLAELEAAAKAGSRDAYALASFRLTTRLRALCENGLLYDMVQSLALQTLRYSRLGFGTEQGIARSLREWKAILRAVRRRDAAKAAQLVRRRIGGSRDAAMQALKAELEARAGQGEARRGRATGARAADASAAPAADEFDNEETPNGPGTGRSLRRARGAPRALASAGR